MNAPPARTASIFDAGPFAPCPAPFNITTHTFAPAARMPDKLALEVLAAPGEITERWSHGALRAAVLASAGGLAARGLCRGDRVLLRMGNSADLPIVFFAATALGAVPVPVSAQLTAGEVAAIIADLDPALVCVDGNLPMPDPAGAPVLGRAEITALRRVPPAGIAATGPDDPAFIVYTSGTGGRPKGVVHAHRSAWARRMMWDGWYGLTADDRVLHAGAFNWTYTLGAGLTDPWATGATALIYTGPSSREVWPRLAAAHDASIFAAVPGVYRQMLQTHDLRAGFANLRHGLSAGEALPGAVSQAWQAATGKPIYEALGMSEISTYISFSPSQPSVPGRAGVPQLGRRVAILPDDGGTRPVDRGADGLLAVSRRDPGLTLGYWLQPEETAAAFRGEWFVTGDRARMATDDTMTYLGRADDLMTAGGYRVSPAEVEAVLGAHPGVADVAVMEAPLRPGVTGIVAAYVPAHAPVPELELADHCARGLARYKCPRAFRAVGALPRSTNGKLSRRQLREAWAAEEQSG